MQTLLKEKNYEKVFAELFAKPDRKETLLDGDISGRTTRAVERMPGRLPKLGIADFGPGKFEGFRINKMLEIVCREPGTTEIAGTVESLARVAAILSSVILRPPANTPALVVEGTLLCDDLDIYGPVEVRPGGRLLMRNCRVAVSSMGISVAQGAEAELIACRVSGSPAGINAQPGSKVALFSCRLEACFGNVEAENGAGLYAENAIIHIEGCEFFRNDVGLCLTGCRGPGILSSRFHSNASAALVAIQTAGDEPAALVNCHFDGSQSRHSAMVSIEGGGAEFRHCVADSPETCIETADCAASLVACKLRSQMGPALVVNGGKLKAADCEFSGKKGPAILSRGTQGSISSSALEGEPPLQEDVPRSIRIEPKPSVLRPVPLAVAPLLEKTLSSLDQIIGHSSAVHEIERLFRLAHISAERTRQGLPMPIQKHSAIFCGPRGCGKRAAAEVYANGLNDLGTLGSRTILDITLADTPAPPIQAGIVYLRTAPMSGLSLNSSAAAELVAHILRHLPPQSALILDGERNALHAFLRSRPEIAREIPIEVVFSAYQPAELAALFESHCASEHIPLGPDAAKKLLVVLHALHDRLHRRYTDRGGIVELFSETRQNYLERCASEGRFDLRLAAEDISVPVDRAFVCAIERSAEFVALCPSCNAENPWVPDPDGHFACCACGEEFSCRWGLLRTSSFYRRLKTRSDSLRSGAVARRRMVSMAA